MTTQTSKTTTVYISSETETLGSGATQADLDRYATNLAAHLTERFGRPCEVEQRIGSPEPCPGDDEINEYVGDLQAGEGWLDLLGTREQRITVDPEEPFAGLVTDEDVGDLPDEVRAKGARVVAVDLLTAASAAGCGTWDDVALRALTKALERMAAEDGVEDECDSCGRSVLVRDEPPPAPDDDAAWAELASKHNDGCEWVCTRAYRREPIIRET